MLVTAVCVLFLTTITVIVIIIIVIVIVIVIVSVISIVKGVNTFLKVDCLWDHAILLSKGVGQIIIWVDNAGILDLRSWQTLNSSSLSKLKIVLDTLTNSSDAIQHMFNRLRKSRGTSCCLRKLLRKVLFCQPREQRSSLLQVPRNFFTTWLVSVTHRFVQPCLLF